MSFRSATSLKHTAWYSVEIVNWASGWKYLVVFPSWNTLMNYTSLERHKSAPYLRLKNSKRTWKSQKTQSIKLTKRVSNSRKTQTTELARQVPDKRPCIKCCKTSKNWRGTLWWKKIQKVSQFQKNWKGPFGIFQHPFCRKASKNWRGTLWEIFFRKKSQCRKILEGEPFSLSRYGMLRGKRGKTFLVQFGRSNDSIWDHQIS